MKFSKLLRSAAAALLCMSLLAGCGGAGTSSDSNASESTTSSSSDDSRAETVEESTPDVTGEVSEPSSPTTPEEIKVTALKGPTAMGMTKLMSDDEENGYPYEFTITAATDELAPLVIQGKTDIMCCPANMASVLYNKTEGGVKVLALNTLGVLYICENGSNTVTSMADLNGKTIYASGKGATPEFALRYLLKENGIDPDNDVTIEWKSEHSECLASLTATEGAVALLPQPFVTTAQTKAEGINVVLDLTEEWDKLGNGSTCITGAVIARTEFIEQYPEAVDEFLQRYAESVEYVTSNVEEGAALVGKYDIVPEAVAKKAIPECNIVCITGAELKEKLSGYLAVLHEQEPTSVGGKLPADDFYYGA